MATNYFKIIYDQLISIIKDEYPRFAKKNRIFIRDYFKSSDFGPEDIILIYPQADLLVGERSSGGTSISRTDEFTIDLVYAKRYNAVDTDFDSLTGFGENLIHLFSGTNRNATNYWHWLEIGNVYYNQSDFAGFLPEDMLDENGRSTWSGFVMEIVVHRAKYAS